MPPTGRVFSLRRPSFAQDSGTLPSVSNATAFQTPEWHSMAKHCDVCKQSYSDELTVCPHCAEAPVGPEQSGSQSEANQRRSADAVEHSPDSGIGLGRSV